MYVSGAIKKRLELMNVILNVSFIVAITLSVEMNLSILLDTFNLKNQATAFMF